MRRFVSALAAAVAVLALTASATLAIPIPGTLDGEQAIITGGSGLWSTSQALAQTFTPSVSGTLDAVGVYVSQPAAQSALAQPASTTNFIGIFPTTGGIPSGSNMAQDLAFSVTSTPGWAYFIIPSPPNVVAGTQYSILMYPGAGLIDWAGDCTTDNYSGGQALVNDASDPVYRTVPVWSALHSGGAAACQQDFAFQTYISAAPAPTPAPTSAPTSAPTLTPPPTSTTAPAGETTGAPPAAWLVFAGLAAAAAFVTMRRYGLARR